VSTTIADVKNPYEALGLVRIADTVEEFVAACDAALAEPIGSRLAAADAYLEQLSWDKTWMQMSQLVESAAQRRSRNSSRAAVPSASERTTQDDGLTAGE